MKRRKARSTAKTELRGRPQLHPVHPLSPRPHRHPFSNHSLLHNLRPDHHRHLARPPQQVPAHFPAEPQIPLPTLLSVSYRARFRHVPSSPWIGLQFASTANAQHALHCLQHLVPRYHDSSMPDRSVSGIGMLKSYSASEVGPSRATLSCALAAPRCEYKACASGRHRITPHVHQSLLLSIQRLDSEAALHFRTAKTPVHTEGLVCNAGSHTRIAASRNTTQWRATLSIHPADI